jgi:cellulose synthase/poly-beta-1,6-N-acetylglucosamine synthase-like glycosyltransferase
VASLIEEILSNLYLLFAFLLLPYGYNCFYMVCASFKYKPQKPRRLENHPIVTIQLPIFNERYVVSRLLNAVSSIEWPRGKLQIQILDDSSDDTSIILDDLVQKLRLDGHEVQTLRRKTREGFKAGALQNALKFTRGKYIAIFDADFVPPSNFLRAKIPLMEEDRNLGIVQTRWGHVNRNYNRLTETFARAACPEDTTSTTTMRERTIARPSGTTGAPPKNMTVLPPSTSTQSPAATSSSWAAP